MFIFTIDVLFHRKTYYFLEKTVFLTSRKFSVSEHVPHMLLLIRLDHRLNNSAKQIQLFAFRKPKGLLRWRKHFCDSVIFIIS